MINIYTDVAFFKQLNIILKLKKRRIFYYLKFNRFVECILQNFRYVVLRRG